MTRAVLLTFGVVSLLPAAALLSLDILLAIHNRQDSTVWPASLASAVLTAVLLASLLASFAVSSSNLLDRLTAQLLRAWLVCITLVCFSAAAASVAVAVSASRVSDKGEDTLVDGIANNTVVIVYSIVLGVSLLCQVGLLATSIAKLRGNSTPSVASVSTESESPSPTSLKAAWRVKAVPYSSTRPSTTDTQGITSFESTNMTYMQRCTSPAPTYDSARSSFSHTMNRQSSTRRLLSLRELQHPAPFQGESVRESLDTYAESTTDDHHRWIHNLDAPCSLETIPASPVVGETDFGRLSDLSPPPAARQRSRSFSPMGTRLPPPIPDTDSPRGSTDEAHIHPLFRSDSPTPPPVATPGTMVTAAPDAGRVIHHHASNQSLRRLRSGSQLAQSSPLSRSSSSETFGAGKPRERCGSRCGSIREETEDGRAGSPYSAESVLRMGSPAGWLGRGSDETVNETAQRH